jgi:hypothetical protein
MGENIGSVVFLGFDQTMGLRERFRALRISLFMLDCVLVQVHNSADLERGPPLVGQIFVLKAENNCGAGLHPFIRANTFLAHA